jgi:hypothetical protein
MTTILPPNPFDSGATSACAPDDAAASLPQMPSGDAAADIAEPSSSTGGRQEASTPTSTVTVAAGRVDATDDDAYGVGPCMINDLPIIRAENERRRRELVEQHEADCIGEIFAGARKLEQIPGIFDQAAITPADELAYVELKLRDDPWAADLIDMPYGMDGIFDEPPLFIQQQMRA